MGFYAEDYVVESPDMGFRLNRQELGPIIDWDLAVHARFEVEDLEASGNTVQFTLLENNDFLELAGLPPFRLSCVCIVDGGEIRSQEFRVLEGTVDVGPAIAPAVEWAKEIYPELVEEIYPNEQLVYTAESARKWIELLREWRSTTDD